MNADNTRTATAMAGNIRTAAVMACNNRTSAVMAGNTSTAPWGGSSEEFTIMSNKVIGDY